MSLRVCLSVPRRVVASLIRPMATHAGDASDSSSSSPSSSPRRPKIYTKTGDGGTTMLFNGKRLCKTTDYFWALGDTDELNSAIGLAVEFIKDAPFNLSQPDALNANDLPITSCQLLNNILLLQLQHIQSRLLDIGSHIATPRDASSDRKLTLTSFPEEEVQLLEHWIDQADSEWKASSTSTPYDFPFGILPALTSFILPGGGKASAQLHVARSTTRRCERRLVALVQDGRVDAVIGRYFNRLSDYLFTMARVAALIHGMPQLEYKKSRHTTM